MGGNCLRGGFHGGQLSGWTVVQGEIPGYHKS